MILPRPVAALAQRLRQRVGDEDAAMPAARAPDGHRQVRFPLADVVREQALDELGRSGVAAILLSMLPQGEYNYLLLKEIPPADDKGGIRMELLVDMLLFLSALDGESMSQALAALQGVAGGGSAKSVINAQNRIKEFGSRGKGIAE